LIFELSRVLLGEDLQKAVEGMKVEMLDCLAASDISTTEAQRKLAIYIYENLQKPGSMKRKRPREDDGEEETEEEGPSKKKSDGGGEPESEDKTFVGETGAMAKAMGMVVQNHEEGAEDGAMGKNVDRGALGFAHVKDTWMERQKRVRREEGPKLEKKQKEWKEKEEELKKMKELMKVDYDQQIYDDNLKILDLDKDSFKKVKEAEEETRNNERKALTVSGVTVALCHSALGFLFHFIIS
jgi:hypothetical protein